MKILTSKQMQGVDKKAIEKLGIIGPILMENAGIQITNEILKKFPQIQDERVVIVAGKGNNGGDGFVVARHLFNRDCRPIVLLLASKKELKGDAALNAGITDKIGITIKEITSSRHWGANKRTLSRATVVVDAIFGTGLTSPARGLYANVIQDINKCKGFKVAVDIPSGLSSDVFSIIGPCIKADLTVTLAAAKVAHVFPPAEDCVGELKIGDISVPPYLFEDEKFQLEMVEKERIRPYFEHRKKGTHKGTYGHLLMLSGSVGKTGAAALAGKAALKMGAGLVTAGVPKSCLPIVARSMMELMTEPLPETAKGTLSAEALPEILPLLKEKDALMLGPGISTHESTKELVLSLLPELKIPVILDADALNILAHKLSVLKSLSTPAVVTPHPGEFARMLKLSTKEVLARKLELVPGFAKKFGVYVVLKGYRTLTSTPNGKTFINPTGNPGMATAGSGDVLSGMIASMIIQEKNILDAILAAVYVHGLSGDIGTARLGDKSLTAGSMITYLSAAIKALS
ncbi:MAG: NAD(P)H-hydrate dehydratase [Candidatus Aminicenantes bacterium]|nr:MAG: NAD(P)H-hydrate dehydratase [Candidatus Aminicenantes bacterium]